MADRLPTHRLLLIVLAFAPPAVAGEIEFNRDVRPILSDKCLACHGPDQGQRKAGLRLDREDSATAKLKSGRAAIVRGQTSESELLRRIDSSDPEERMPPPKSGKTLSDREKATLARWIAGGARWQGHWAYEPLVRPALPTGDAVAGLGAIDAFVRARLAAEGLAPAREADRITLVRRLSFDLTGLPPGAERVERFLADGSKEAYAKLVDEFLASPAYGERMAVWWLDLARYADSVGYHGDQDQSVWPYRDYVIRSFNENRPFDRFTLEQIAGDLLENASLEQKVASGYNRLAMKSAEGGVQEKEYFAKYASERVRAVTGAWMGATLGCAECHDHKFDPYTTRDFYSFAAFWGDMTERGIYSGAESSGEWGPTIKVPRPEDSARIASLDSEIANVELEIKAPTTALAEEQAAWEKSFAPTAWTVLRPSSVASAGGAHLEVKDDGSILASGPNPDTDITTVTVAMPMDGITALRLEVIPDDSLPQKGSGRAGNGNFVLNEIEVRHQAAGGTETKPVTLQNATATHEQSSFAEKNPHGRWSVEEAIDGDAKGAKFGWAILDRVKEAQEAVFELKESLPSGPGSLTFTLRQAQGNGGHNLGRFRLSATTAPRPVKAFGAGLPEAIRATLAVDREKRMEAQTTELARHFRSIAPSLEPARKKLEKLRAERAETDRRVPKTLTTVAMAPRTLRVLPRGNWMDDSGDSVAPAVPKFLPQPKARAERATRLDLATWLTAKENPITARNIANRVWKLFFGVGLSRKLEDLGSQGEWPTHPELLDWLAVELRDGGWDLKSLIRELVLSETYRQSSIATPETLERDPYNKLLARQGRFRLDAEMVRDAALATSGLLSLRVGGPSAKPYQPPGYWSYLNFPAREYQADTGENQYRRGLYTHWQRQYLHPSLAAFDAPSREECTADRVRSSTPIQALVLLNDPTYVEAARVFAESILRQGGAEPAEKAAWAVRRALSRAARPAEIEILVDLYRKHREQYTLEPGAASELLTTGLRPAPGEVPPVELAAWTSVARAIFNLHEMITRS